MLKWPPQSKDKTSVESKRLFSPTPDDLRALVFDYLCHSSFTETARAFVRDSAVRHIDADGDEIMGPESGGGRDALADTLDERLIPAERRREIRISILSGRVDEAIHLLHTYFPTVLPQESPQAPTDPCPYEPSSLSDDSFTYESETSIDPTHLLLNLRIIGFIEAARTVPLPYHHPGASPSPARLAIPVKPESREGDDDPELSEQQLLLLHKAQKLYSEANCLPKATDRASYLKELAQVSALLAYPKPEDSIMAPYLAQDRREAVADQIERAIFYRLGQSSVSHIEICTRYTSALWGALHDGGWKLPSRAKWPPGVTPSGPVINLKGAETTNTPGDKATPPGKKASEKDSERAPLFSLAEFLNSKG